MRIFYSVFFYLILNSFILNSDEIIQIKKTNVDEIKKLYSEDEQNRKEIMSSINTLQNEAQQLAKLKEFEKAGCLFKIIEIKFCFLFLNKEEMVLINEKLNEKNGSNDLFNKSEFVKAYQQYDRILDEIRKKYPIINEPINDSLIENNKKKFYKIEHDFFKDWSKNLEEEANASYLNKDYKKSIDLSDNSTNRLNDAKELNPNEKNGLKKELLLKNKSKEELKHTEFEKDISIDTIDPEHKNNKYKIDQYLNSAKVLIKSKQYVNARDILEKILVIDPYNQEAMKLLKNLYKELFSIGNLRKEVEEIDKLAEVVWGFNEPILPKDISRETENVEKVLNKDSKLYEKLESLIIDKIEFEEATVPSVIAYLKRESQRVDTENIGVSIVLRLNPAMTNSLPRISMVLNDIPIGEVIKYICQATDLKYRIEERAVIIGDESINDMQRKTFSVRVALIQSIAPDLELQKDKASGGVTEKKTGKSTETFTYDVESTFDIKAESGKPTKKLASETLRKYFTDRGILFPENSEIAYDTRSGKLFVTNTPENLRRMDNLLRELDIVSPLVLIETKFVEINQEDLEELGFEWTFSKSPYYTMPDANGNNFTYNDNWAVNYFDQGTTNEQHGNDSLMRHYGSENATFGKLINNLRFTPQINGREFGDLSFFMYALDRSGTSNLLSSPKVIATSGSPALIRMVREEYFPDSWNTPEANIVGNAFSYTPAYPEFGEGKDIGIRLAVTPTVNPNNYTITLELKPEVTDFTGWTTYPYVMLLGDLGTTTADIKMAEISRRDVLTNVVIYDGETVILGGMLREYNQGTDDRVTGLGDIPLIGRLFRSQIKQDVKKNLLIFVTARLVSPDGVPVRKNIPNGIFDYNR